MIPVFGAIGLIGAALLSDNKSPHHDCLPGGRADARKPTDFDQRQLAMGIRIEAEHTDNPLLAREIAMDHLAEIPDYYTRLVAMERDAEGFGRVETPMTPGETRVSTAGVEASRWLESEQARGSVPKSLFVQIRGRDSSDTFCAFAFRDMDSREIAKKVGPAFLWFAERQGVAVVMLKSYMQGKSEIVLAFANSASAVHRHYGTAYK